MKSYIRSVYIYIQYVCVIFLFGEGNGTPLQYSCLEIPWTEEPGGLQSWGHKESDTTEQLHSHNLPIRKCWNLKINIQNKF